MGKLYKRTLNQNNIEMPDYPNKFFTTVYYNTDIAAILKSISVVYNRVSIEVYGGEKDVPDIVVGASTHLCSPSLFDYNRFGLGFTTLVPTENKDSFLPLFENNQGEFKIPNYLLFIKPTVTGNVPQREPIYFDMLTQKIAKPIGVGSIRPSETPNKGHLVVFYPKIHKGTDDNAVQLAKEKLNSVSPLDNKNTNDEKVQKDHKNFLEQSNNLMNDLEKKWKDYQNNVATLEDKAKNTLEKLKKIDDQYDWADCVTEDEAREIGENQLFEGKTLDTTLYTNYKEAVTGVEEYITARIKFAKAKDAVTKKIENLLWSLQQLMGLSIEGKDIVGAEKIFEALEAVSSLIMQMAGKENDYEGEVKMHVCHVIKMEFKISQGLFDRVGIAGSHDKNISSILMAGNGGGDFEVK